MNTMKILLMFANEYDIKAEDGSNVSGCTLNYYFFGENGEALATQEKESGAIGYQRAKCSIPFEYRPAAFRVPAIYDAQFEMSIGSDGKPVMKVVNLQYVQDVKFSPVKVG